MIETILGALILIYGTVYALLLLRAAWKDRAGAAEEPGAFWKLSVCEAAVYFFTTMGVPDFILNTMVFQKCRWVDDRRLPGTWVAAAVFPSALIAFSYLCRGTGGLDMATTLLCAAAIAAGSLTGARVMTALPAAAIRKIMAIAMLASMGAMVLKLVVSSGAAGTGGALAPWQLCIALPVIFGLGFLNMFGVPMKPPAIALLLLMGLSPINTLTLMLVMGVVSPMVGGIRVLRSALYQKKIALAAVSFGALGALAGTAFTVTLPAGILTAVLLVIMALTSVSMLRKST